MRKKKFWIWKYPDHPTKEKLVLLTNDENQAKEQINFMASKGIPGAIKTPYEK